MKRTIIIIGLIITFFILYFLQVNFFPFFTIFGIRPNLFVIFILFVGLFTNQIVGMSFSIVFGLLIDFTYSKEIGVTAMMLCCIAYLASYFDKNFSKDNKLTIIIMVIAATVLFEVGKYFIDSVIINYERELFAFIKILLIEIVYNVLLTIIFYPIMQKIGYVIDRNFKENNILTRYF